MRAALAIDPGEQWACLILMEASRALGDWPAARAAFERTAASGPRAMDAALVEEYAESLERTGDAPRAAALRDSLARAATPHDPQASGASRR